MVQRLCQLRLSEEHSFCTGSVVWVILEFTNLNVFSYQVIRYADCRILIVLNIQLGILIVVTAFCLCDFTTDTVNFFFFVL